MLYSNILIINTIHTVLYGNSSNLGQRMRIQHAAHTDNGRPSRSDLDPTPMSLVWIKTLEYYVSISSVCSSTQNIIRHDLCRRVDLDAVPRFCVDPGSSPLLRWRPSASLLAELPFPVARHVFSFAPLPSCATWTANQAHAANQHSYALRCRASGHNG